MMEWVDEIEDKIKNKKIVNLLDDLPIKKDLWLKNFIKSAVSTTLIALAINFIFNGFKHPRNYEEILLGIIAFLLAVVVIFVIDSYHQKVRELELRSIDSNCEVMKSNLTDKYLEEEIDKIMRKKLKETFDKE